MWAAAEDAKNGLGHTSSNSSSSSVWSRGLGKATEVLASPIPPGQCEGRV